MESSTCPWLSPLLPENTALTRGPLDWLRVERLEDRRCLVRTMRGVEQVGVGYAVFFTDVGLRIFVGCLVDVRGDGGGEGRTLTRSASKL